MKPIAQRPATTTMSRRACSPLRTDCAPRAGRPNNLADNNHRRGYTLLELMLVLGILLVIAGIAWPAVQGMYQRHQLQSAADDLRAQLAGTRFHAIDSGIVYQFVYEPGGQSYSILPFETTAAATHAETAALPDPIRFGATDELANSTASLLTEAVPAQTGSSNLSTPILFTPDGSAIDASVTLIDEEGRTIRLSVRGLTAAVSVGSVLQRASR